MKPKRRNTTIHISEPQMPRWWDALIITITIVTLLLLLGELWLGVFSGGWGALLGWVDLGVCLLFLVDFFWRFRRADRRWAFVWRNWIDLVAAIPMVGPLRAGRLVRLARLVRLVRVLALARRVWRRVKMPAPSVAVRYLGGITAGIWLLAASLFYAFEFGVNQNVKGVDDALWWSLTTLSTVGYGDLYPVTPGGRLIAATTMAMGVGVLASFAGTISTLFVELRERGRRGLRGYSMENHLLLLGWNEKAPITIEEFFLDPRYRDSGIVLVADLEALPIDDARVHFVKGRPARREALERASASQALSAIVLAIDPRDPRSDLETALAVMTLRRLNPTMRISAELVDVDHREHLEQAGCDVIIETHSLAASLLVHSTLNAGLAHIITDILSVRDGANCERVPVEPSFIGKTYQELAHAQLDEGRLVLGIGRGREVFTSPPLKFILQEGDEAFIVYQTQQKSGV